MKVTLLLTEGPEAGKSFEFMEADTFLVGRTSKAHLRFDQKADRLISRTHFLLEIRPPRCHINDLNSKNGTFVNDKAIKRIEIRDGDVIRVGITRIKVSITHEKADLEKESPTVTPTTIDLKEANRNAEPGAPASAYDCHQCGQDLSSQVNADGLAADLEGSIYLCEKCTAAQQDQSLDVTKIRNYDLLSLVGQGGMGQVYKSVHRPSRRVCAIKMLRPELIVDEYASRVFEREIDVQSKVHHPNLVRIIERGRVGPTPFFVTEFLRGGDVRNLVVWEFQGCLPPPLACEVTIQILSGLKSLHERGFIHRDLKPANFLLDRPYTEKGFKAKIADYGLAKSFETAGHSIFDYTSDGLAAGSFIFIPPEQITNYKFVKPPVDVYAVGVSLYYMLSSRYSIDFPLEPEKAPQTGAAVKPRHPIQVLLEDQPIPLRDRMADLPASLAEVVDKAVRKDPNQRWQSAAEFQSALLEVSRIEGWETR